MIDAPGFYEIDAATYHADPVVQPSLSASILRLLDQRSPLHAWVAHPKLNPGWEPVQRTDFDIGSAAHKLILEAGDISDFDVLDFADYRTKAAQAARDASYAAGRTPLLQKHSLAVLAIAKAAFAAVPILGHAGPSVEETLVWQDGFKRGIWCRARPDWRLGDDLIDLKTTTNAEPGGWIRGHLFADGLDIQAAWYMRGYRALTGREPTWRWVVVEREPPYALSVIAPTPAILVLAEKKLQRAIDIWQQCLEADKWPSYPQVAWAELPTWQEQAVTDRELREQSMNILASG